MIRKKKIYFYATEMVNKDTNKSSLVFSGQNGMRGHRAGGGENQVNFVLEKLIEINGVERGAEIYQKFNEALLSIAKDNTNENWDFPKSALVFMEKIDDNKIGNSTSVYKKNGAAIHTGEQRPHKDAESKEEGTATT